MYRPYVSDAILVKAKSEDAEEEIADENLPDDVKLASGLKIFICS